MHLRSQGSTHLEPIDHEIKRTFKHNQRERKEAKMMSTLNERKRLVVAATPSCIVLSEAARDYEMKNNYFNAMPQFHGHPGENPLNFITEFYGFIRKFTKSADKINSFNKKLDCSRCINMTKSLCCIIKIYKKHSHFFHSVDVSRVYNIVNIFFQNNRKWSLNPISTTIKL
ncbi:unnamed protein product [Cuscuta europaea]|uniref:Uncharacterized protein n=1 Tax=Cuscuta europaea TaxID=41803 RepID=A0A9P0YWU9_CUSEU|nr:unnamed protein product [Cuscuta europaea]